MHLNYEVPDYKRVRVILDTDCACEADDPFAIAYALMSPKLMVKAIIAEHFARPDSMQDSYDAILKLTNAMHLQPNVLHGEEFPLSAAHPASEGVQFICDSDGHSPKRIADYSVPMEVVERLHIPFELIANWEKLPRFRSRKLKGLYDEEK